MQRSRARTERLWKDYLRDPSLWRHNRTSKTNPMAPDFQHKLNQDSLWLDQNIPSWVKDSLRQEGILKSHEEEEEEGEVVASYGGDRKMISLEEALSSLEEELLPQVSLEDFALILDNCRKERDRLRALRLHAYMLKNGLEAHRSLGNYLVSMLVEVGSMHNAQLVFDRLAYRNELSWNSLITGYIKCGKPQNALSLYQKMQKDGSVHPNGHTFVALLKTCAKLKNLERGLEIHAQVTQMRLLEGDLFVGSSLVDMYAKCSSLVKAQQIFDELPVRDVVMWTTLISGYVEHGHGEEALKYFEKMQLEGVSPNAVTFVFCLKACSSIRATDKAQEIHADIERRGLLQRDLVVGNTLVDMYAKFGWLAIAQEVFDKLPVRNVVSWTTLMGGYAEHGHGEKALKCFEQMQVEGVSPDATAFVCSLKACGIIGSIHKGGEIHAEIERQGLLERNLFVGSTLVDMYAKCGSLAKAQQVSDRLPIRNLVLWNSLIAGYVEHGHCEEALKCFDQMQLEGVFPDAVTFVCSLKACGNIRATDKARELHAEIERQGLLERDLLVGNTLVDMYAKCGSFAMAQKVLDKLAVRDVVSWTALMAGYVEHGHGDEALSCFEQMRVEGVSPDFVTFVCSLKACGSIGATAKGQEIHAEIERQGLLETNLVVGNTLVDMYAKCGLLAKAQKVFEKLPVRNVVSWNALITGYVEHGHNEKALKCFKQMQIEGVFPNAVTFVCSLKACGSIGATNKSQEIHAEIKRQGLEKDLVVGNTLVDMYAKCGSLVIAQQVFDKLPVRDIVSWTSLISGYVEIGHGEEALKCFEQIQLDGVSPNAVTFICSLKACGSIGATGKGCEIHAEIERQGLLETDLVGNTLVDMYAKCGYLAKAQEVFDKLPVRDVVSWTALMAGHAQLGESESVFHIFDIMLGEGVKPDPVTFIVVLTACNRTGLLSKSQTYFEDMSKEYGIAPTFVHHSCMVDLLGRSGQLDEAVFMIKKMLFFPDLVVWHSVLGACNKWGNVEFGKQAFEHAVCLDEKDSAAYVLMAHIYAGADLREEVSAGEATRVKVSVQETRALFVD